jgi:hypothetical protein
MERAGIPVLPGTQDKTTVDKLIQTSFIVMPAKAGIQEPVDLTESGLSRHRPSPV